MSYKTKEDRRLNVENVEGKKKEGISIIGGRGGSRKEGDLNPGGFGGKAGGSR